MSTPLQARRFSRWPLRRTAAFVFRTTAAVAVIVLLLAARLSAEPTPMRAFGSRLRSFKDPSRSKRSDWTLDMAGALGAGQL